MTYQKTILYELLTLVAFILMICTLATIAAIGPATGYEISIYSAYPPYFWFFLVASFALGISILLLQAFSQERSNWWLAGLAVVVMSNLIFFLLPLMRGYFYFDAYDSLTMVAYVQDIENTGHLFKADFYPIIHILIFALAKLGNISLFEAGLLMPALNNVLYIIGVLLLTTSLNFSHRQRLIAIALASAPFFVVEAYTATPRGLAFALLPWLLYLYFRSRIGNRLPWSILFLLLLGSMVVLHPFNGGLLLMPVFLIIFITLQFYRKIPASGDTVASGIRRNLTADLNAMILLIVVWFLWYSNFRFFTEFVQYFAHITKWMPSQASYYFSVAGERGLSFAEMIIIFLRLHGHNLLYLALAGVGSICLVKKSFARHQATSPYLLTLVPLLILFSIIVIVAPFLPFRFEYYRLLHYAIMPAVLINAWFLGDDGVRLSRRIAFTTALALALIGLLIGVFNTYPSPWIQGANQHITTHASVSGARWFVANQDEVSPIDGIAITPYQSLLWVTGYETHAPNIYHIIGQTVPPHFGYDRYDSVGEAYEKDRYWLLHTSAYYFYEERIPDHPGGWLWTIDELDRLHSDPALSLVYTNGEFDVFYLEGLAKEQRSP